mmetsp:Transcript_14286/g.25783  ORF Transcript_14286/g.25783 Transcript_14286/m.25783 type:complete len:84 (+) Transcript_14286:153-404(+)
MHQQQQRSVEATTTPANSRKSSVIDEGLEFLAQTHFMIFSLTSWPSATAIKRKIAEQIATLPTMRSGKIARKTIGKNQRFNNR